jgi:CheY-like chemotaxis protein
MKTVLFVEDSKILQMVSQRRLTKAGYQVLLAEDGEKALAVAQSNRPDIIVLDMMLPKLSGPQVLGRLQQHPATAHIPVIVLTGLSKKNEEKLRKEGAMAFIEKNQSADNPNLLLLTIEQVLSQETVPNQTFDGIPLDIIEPAAPLHQ